jgi:hypothetical protein
MEKLVYDSFDKFVQMNVMKYHEYEEVPVHFTGSVAYFYRPILEKVCLAHNINIAEVAKDPTKGLVRYHT